ncbi:alpha/beta hydrolase-fold protein [Aquibacillus koreensis]|uniref:Alpha/beta hydrolase-fold protein n=1 Tax=Aquibacillus koreensis TaxID=279446 RepID=A0A9X4AKL5_9BACI|nr:alpha/beta hydrolase-fold protein [Aquibacillus koreensis]MCT2536721.1 alpha/beta hydrolase-fold protein [Aquibacillus koreensis]MDC3421523.1 alpha/beta hydrolase-fold protein [Aquibacillus koreensis]
MAMLQVNYHSKALQREVIFNALIPLDTMEIPGKPTVNQRPMKALYLLHGYSGGVTDWISFSKIRELSDKFHVAVFMPAGENHFYIDDEDRRALYGEYVGNELVKYTRELFPLSHNKEDTFIGGFSMGGYGAIRNGLKYAGNFGRIIALSSAIITYNIQNASTDYDDGIADYKYLKSVFGDLTQLQGSGKDPEALLRNLKKTDTRIPEIYLACGTEDFLLDVNHKFRDFLKSEHVEHTYLESPGGHTWDFWNEYIEKGLMWAIK